MKRFLRVSFVLGLVVAAAFGALLAATWAPPYVADPGKAFPQAEPFAAPAAARAQGPGLVLLVFDGFARATYERAATPNLDRMRAEGASTLDMRPVWPSVSLTNHFSLSTGCYPERHGVVSNHFQDPERGLYDLKGDADWLLDCEPLHVVAEAQGVRSAVFAWVGNTSSTRGPLASVAEPFGDGASSPAAQVQKVIAQLQRPEAERPGYIAAYCTEPDSAGHRDGPLGAATLAAAEAVDAAVGEVMAAIERLGLAERVSLVVTTDHGMVAAHTSVNLPRLLGRAGVEGRLLAEVAVGHVYLEDPGTRLEAIAALRTVGAEALVEVVDPHNPPPGLRIGHSRRVGDILLLPKPGYFGFDLGLWPPHLRFLGHVGPDSLASSSMRGSHGYDPARVPGVRSIFFAWGGRVARGVELPKLDAVDLHPTLAHLLTIEPGAPLDGTARTGFILPVPPQVQDAGVAGDARAPGR